jgi:hypothetical protein
MKKKVKKDKKSVTVRLNQDVIDAIVKMAYVERRTITNMTEVLIVRGLEKK